MTSDSAASPSRVALNARTPRSPKSRSTVPAGTDEAAVRKAFGVKAGRPYDFFEIRNGIQRVEESLVEQGYLQSRVRLERGVEADQAHLTLHVTPGPRVDLQFMGATPPAKISGRGPYAVASRRVRQTACRRLARMRCASG